MLHGPQPVKKGEWDLATGVTGPGTFSIFRAVLGLAFAAALGLPVAARAVEPEDVPTQGITAPELVEIEPVAALPAPPVPALRTAPEIEPVAEAEVAPETEIAPAAEIAPATETAPEPVLPVETKIAEAPQDITLDEIAVLSAADAGRYRRIFALQRQGRWREADALVAQLGDKLLMGHVKFQRYMHPTAYRSKFSELDEWLNDYPDHPEAARIYKLARRRKPSAAGAPERPERKSWRYGTRALTAFEVYNPKRSAAHRRRAARTERYVRSLLKRERPTQALNHVSLAKIRNRLTTVEFDRIRQWIAVSYYMEQVDEKAYALAADVARRNGKAVPHAHWTAGLAAWRMGDLAKAGGHFEAFAKAEHINEWERSAGAYWAARAFLSTRQGERVLPMLRLAAKSELSFYGVLARRQLGLSIVPDWHLPQADEAAMAQVLASPHVRRAIALVQAGETARAEKELTWAHGLLEDRHDAALLRVAAGLDLPAVEYKVAISTGAQGCEAGLFPVPDFMPRGGYDIDRPLLFAIIRKESKFLAGAESRAGARGLMQLMPITAEEVTGDRRYRRSKSLLKDLFDPAVNLDLGQTYVKHLLGAMEPKGNLLKFLAAYNAGPGNLARWLRTVRYQDDPLLFVESLPVPETRSYVEKVLASYWIYRARLGQEIPSLDAVIEGAWPLYMRQEPAPGSVAALIAGPAVDAD